MGKPAKIMASRRIKAKGLASLLRSAPTNGAVGGIDKNPATYWRNAKQTED